MSRATVATSNITPVAIDVTLLFPNCVLVLTPLGLYIGISTQLWLPLDQYPQSTTFALCSLLPLLGFLQAKAAGGGSTYLVYISVD